MLRLILETAGIQLGQNNRPQPERTQGRRSSLRRKWSASASNARHRYEFGAKVRLAITATKGLIVGARGFPGNSYDDDMLAEQLEQIEILSGHKPTTAIVDLGFRGREIPGTQVLHRGRSKKRLTRARCLVPLSSTS